MPTREDWKKARERFFVQDAARRLGVAWEIIDREEPDFEIRSAGETFGLEVTEVFVDPKADHGSEAKRGEAERRKVVARWADRYYGLGGPPIDADFLQMPPMSDDHVRRMMAAAPRKPGRVERLEAEGLTVYMSPAPPGYKRWQFVPDMVGYVRVATPADLQPAIDEKGEKLDSYRERYASVELLIVAHRMTNAGRLAAPDGLVVDKRGFRNVYFLSYPEDAVPLSGQATAVRLNAILTFKGKVPDGDVVEVLAPPWLAIVDLIKRDPSAMYKIPPRKWEEIIAAAYKADGWDEVILTPRSGDGGRDVIATKRGRLNVRFLDQVKAYKPGHVVTADEVRALVGVVASDPTASKGVVTTTSDFAPKIVEELRIQQYVPTRLELINGAALQERLNKIALIVRGRTEEVTSG